MASIKRVGTKSGRALWDVKYRVAGRHIHRRMTGTRKEIERQVELSQGASGTNLSWREGFDLYCHHSTLKPMTLAGYEDSISRLSAHVGDKTPIEGTSAAQVKAWVLSISEASSPTNANKHLRQIKAVAKWLSKHTGAVSLLPFSSVPPLPDKKQKRPPVPLDQLPAYWEAIPGWLQRPLLMVLYAGIRSAAACRIREPEDVGETIHVVDKFGKERDILMDPVLGRIVVQAQGWRSETGSKTPYMFVGEKGQSLNRHRLLEGCQYRWAKAGLEKRTVHDFRRTLSTAAGAIAHPDQISALMGHHHRQSSEAYITMEESTARDLRLRLTRKFASLLPHFEQTRQNATKHSPTENNIKQVTLAGAKCLIPQEVIAELVAKYGVTE